ncbi:uncharacterized protein M6B38_302625 [Iris pallida]|uniref:NHL repeat-containing protein n=1 Tax=Iris pallida TaxID=29817 RepID=A0AAX6HPK3_IRIPA|nr:uncharacterized protein M6B38_302625 [Iris pallida]
MNRSILLLFLSIAISLPLHSQVEAASSPTGAIVKHLSSVLKWTRSSSSSPKAPRTEGDSLQFENGYFVETLVEGNKLGVVPYTVRVSSQGGDLFAVDSLNNNIVKITPPLSQYSRARLVAGSFQGYSGHVDGKPSDARFHRPKGVTMDDKGNIYVADTTNLAIRKIGETGVTTIAGGKSNVAGYRDGPSEDAMFSTDFDVLYVASTCSLLVVDRGNAALRQISLQQEDCDQQYNSISTSDIVMVFGAVLAGYFSCLLQHGFGSSFHPKVKQAFETTDQDHTPSEKSSLIVESLKEEEGAGWPSFGRLLSDLLKFSMEALGNVFLNLIPQSFRIGRSKEGLTPLKDNLVMPEDNVEPPLVQKQMSSTPISETHHAPNISNDSPPKPQKTTKTPKYKDPSLSGKHRSSKKQDYSEFYGPGEGPQLGSKSQKDRVRHRHRDKSGEASFGAVGSEPKPVEKKSMDYSDAKFDHYNIRSKYGADPTYRY